MAVVIDTTSNVPDNVSVNVAHHAFFTMFPELVFMPQGDYDQNQATVKWTWDNSDDYGNDGGRDTLNNVEVLGDGFMEGLELSAAQTAGWWESAWMDMAAGSTFKLVDNAAFRCDTVTGWTADADAIAEILNTTDKVEGSGCLDLGLDVSNSVEVYGIWYVDSGAIDLSEMDTLHIAIYVATGIKSDISSTNPFRIRVRDSSANAAEGNIAFGDVTENQWNFIRIPRSDFSDVGAATDWTDITRIAFYIYEDASPSDIASGDIKIDEIFFYTEGQTFNQYPFLFRFLDEEDGETISYKVMFTRDFTARYDNQTDGPTAIDKVSDSTSITSTETLLNTLAGYQASMADPSNQRYRFCKIRADISRASTDNNPRIYSLGVSVLGRKEDVLSTRSGESDLITFYQEEDHRGGVNQFQKTLNWSIKLKNTDGRFDSAKVDSPYAIVWENGKGELGKKTGQLVVYKDSETGYIPNGGDDRKIYRSLFFVGFIGASPKSQENEMEGIDRDWDEGSVTLSGVDFIGKFIKGRTLARVPGLKDHTIEELIWLYAFYSQIPPHRFKINYELLLPVNFTSKKTRDFYEELYHILFENLGDLAFYANEFGTCVIDLVAPLDSLVVQTFGTGSGEFHDPEAAFPYQGEMYITDHDNDRIQVIKNKTGDYVRKWGSTGAANGEYDGPFSILVYGDEVYVGELGNDRIQVSDLDGVYQRKWGSNGAGNGQFSNPRGMCEGGGEIYICDRGNTRIQVFDPDGTYKRKWSTDSGLGPGQCFFYDSELYVVVAGGTGCLVEVYNSAGVLQRNWRVASASFTSIAFGLAVDSNGVVYVSVTPDTAGATDEHYIKLYSSAGTYLGSYGSPGTLIYENRSTIGNIFIDERDTLYKTDPVLARISKHVFPTRGASGYVFDTQSTEGQAIDILNVGDFSKDYINGVEVDARVLDVSGDREVVYEFIEQGDTFLLTLSSTIPVHGGILDNPIDDGTEAEDFSRVQLEVKEDGTSNLFTIANHLEDNGAGRPSLAVDGYKVAYFHVFSDRIYLAFEVDSANVTLDICRVKGFLVYVKKRMIGQYPVNLPSYDRSIVTYYLSTQEQVDTVAKRLYDSGRLDLKVFDGRILDRIGNWVTFGLGILYHTVGDNDIYALRFSCLGASLNDGEWSLKLLEYNDGMPPAPATGFSATRNGADIDLAWTNPIDSDFARVVIRSRADYYPSDITDGTAVYVGRLTSYSHTIATAQYYSVWAIDSNGNISEVVQDNAGAAP